MKNQKGNVRATRGWPPSQLQVNLKLWKWNLPTWKPNYELDDASETQCIYFKEGEGVKKNLFSSWDANLIYFCGTRFSSSMVLNEIICQCFKRPWIIVIGGGNQIWVFNSIEKFLTITFVTRMNVQTLRSQGVDKKLYLQNGKT